ncbi:sensor histidine kinase [Algoriphagus namhaensis]
MNHPSAMPIFLMLIWTTILLPAYQISKPDSLRAVYTQATSDSTRIVSSLELAKYYYAFDQDSALVYTRQAISHAGEDPAYRRYKANALNIEGVVYLIKSDFEKSLQTHLEALKIREAIQDSAGVMETYLNLGNIHYRLGELDLAVQKYKESLSIAEAINHEAGMSLLFNNLGSYYLDRWMATEAEEDYRQAAEYLENSKEIKEKLGTGASLIQTLNLLTDLYFKRGDTKKGEEMIRRAILVSEQNRDNEGKIELLTKLADLEQAKGNNREAKRLLEEGYQIALDMGSAFMIRSSAQRLGNLAETQGDYKEALEYLKIYVRNTDSIFNETRQKIRDELAVQYESEKKDLENQRLLQEQSYAEQALKQKNQLIIAAVGVALIFLVLLYFLRKSNQKLKVQAQKINQQSQILKESNTALSEANKFREKLFSIISHDLRAPFNGLQNSLDLWESGDLTKEDLDHLLGLIKSDTQTASSMLENLLNWARVQIASEQIVKNKFVVAELIQEILTLFEKEIKKKQLNIHIELSEDLTYFTDRERLNFALRNLIKNAIKFTPSGGDILIKASSTQLIVQDSGVGMTAEQVQKIEGNTQYSTPGTDGEQGTGIGYMLSKEFIQSLGGQISIESAVGEGSRFSIDLRDNFRDA